MKELIRQEKTCPNCSASLHCGSGNAGSCWCDALPAIMPLDGEKACYCPACLKSQVLEKIGEALAEEGGLVRVLEKVRSLNPADTLLEGLDYYYTPEGYWVFTSWYHLKRGSCCRNGCRHCPYGFKKQRT